MTGLVRMSHSRYEEYSSCGERYRLARIERVPTTPSIYAIAGTAFHAWAEHLDLNGYRDNLEGYVSYWGRLLNELVKAEEDKSGLPLARWDTPARSKDANQKAFEKFRDELGPEWLEKYIEWRNTTDWRLATLPPDGNGRTVGAEYELRYTLDSVDDLAIVDRIFETDDGRLIAIDLKTWSRKRNTAQLPSYVVACRQNGINVTHAGYYDARKGEITDLDEYKYWDEKRLAALHEQAAHMMQAGFFLPRISDDCNSICSVRWHCQFSP